MSARPFAVGGRLAVPSVHIAAEPRSVGAPLVGALASQPQRGDLTQPRPAAWVRETQPVFYPQALKGRANRCLHHLPNGIFIAICGTDRWVP